MNKGTIWSFVCPCGRDHERRRRVVSVDLLNEERKENERLRRELKEWEAAYDILKTRCDEAEQA